MCPGYDDLLDLDGDLLPDACDRCPLDAGNDADADGTCNGDDVCPYDPSNDGDRDGLCVPEDRCPNDPANDADRDGLCADGACAASDPCPLDADDDADGDGACADVDPCPADPENDGDADGWCEIEDNCPFAANPRQEDPDGDGVGTACEADSDGDGVSDDEDTCPAEADAGQDDRDGDGIGDVCELDGDGHGYAEDLDCDDEDPAVSPSALDRCGDGVDDDCDGSDAAACAELLVTVPAGFALHGGALLDQSAAADTQVYVQVRVGGRGVAFQTGDFQDDAGRWAVANLGRTLSPLEEGEVDTVGIACGRPVAWGVDARGRDVVWTPAWNKGSMKRVDLWAAGADQDRDGVSDQDEVLVACTDPRPGR